MTIAIIIGIDAIIGGVWIICERKARAQQAQAATGKRLAEVIAEGRFTEYYTPALSPDEIAQLNTDTSPD
jgi:hypothetical protein